ncbi:hypothetical protein [Isoalcanivorax indicus]|uniref:hypothetical protein n=1 Tax=Isoalcanivorax indicus TaxID=2202653 RepID=UPI000DBAA44E|nr:hypothetical protein [Isoalcanivorax indicus]
MTPVTREQQRQAWLKAMGLTPWVARAPLPGAAAPVWLGQPAPAPAQGRAQARNPLPPERQASPGAGAGESPSAAGAGAGPEAGGAVLRQASEALTAPARASAPRPEPAPQAPRAAVARGPRFTLQAYATPNVWVVVEQEDADAPELGRAAQGLLANLLRVWQVGPGQPRRFLCPPDGQHITPDDAGLALGAFLQGLTRSGSARRVLLCASEDTARLILPQRFIMGEGDQAGWLAISSLAEMLDDPGTHKRRSWHAMVQAGLHA